MVLMKSAQDTRTHYSHHHIRENKTIQKVSTFYAHIHTLL